MFFSLVSLDSFGDFSLPRNALYPLHVALVNQSRLLTLPILLGIGFFDFYSSFHTDVVGLPFHAEQ